MTERTIETSAGRGFYAVTFDAEGRALRVASVTVQCNGESRTRRFWKAGQPVSITAACAIRSAQRQLPQ
jgi:hypothetical protein